MGLIQYGAALAKISGRVAGNVFAHNKGGAYMRRFSVPTNPSTTRQQAVRSSFGQAASGWKLLTQLQRDAWGAWAQTHPVINRLGAALTLSGIGAYVQIANNAAVYEGDGTLYPDPPAAPTFFPPDSLTLSAVADESADTLVLTQGVAAAADVLWGVWASPPVSAGRANPKDKQRLIGAFSAPSAGVYPLAIPLTTEYHSVWGSLASRTGDVIFLTLYQENLGQLSVGFTIAVTVVP